MVSLGSATFPTMPIALNANNIPTIYQGGYLLTADRVMKTDLPLIPTPPIMGQIWPRGIVGDYIASDYATRAPGSLGSAKLRNLSQEVRQPNSVIGQLWPRGDFVPNPKVES